MKKTTTVSQKELRQIARVALAEYLRGEQTDPARANLAVAVLHAPPHKGE